MNKEDLMKLIDPEGMLAADLQARLLSMYGQGKIDALKITRNVLACLDESAFTKDNVLAILDVTIVNQEPG